MNWNNEADAKLSALWVDQSVSCSEIGAAFGTSKSAVIGRAARLGLGRRNVVNNQHGFKGGRQTGKAFDVWEMDENDRREAVAVRASEAARRQRARNAGKKRLPKEGGVIKRLSSSAVRVDGGRTQEEQKPSVEAVGLRAVLD